jgi:nucleoside-diphosphate-sugar epimerase
VYNLADGFGITCREYLAALAGALGLPVPRRRLPRGLVQFLMRVVFPPQPEPTETLHRPSHEALLRLCALFRDSEPDTRRIRSELAFSPPVDFAAGIDATVAWYRKAHPEDRA